MRKFYLLLFVVFAFQCLSAQELAIKSFKADQHSISASTNPRYDNNDMACALVKVQLAAQGAQFEPSVIGEVEYKTSEYWVYLPQGSKRLKVKLEGYLPLEISFDDYGVKYLESKVTYVLTITGVQTGNAAQAEVKMKTGWIILDSKPQGASVYINGDFVGNTPLDGYKQPYGTYSYRIEKPNYHDASGTINLNSAQYEKTEKLQPAFGSISVTTSVNGAKVLLDGKDSNKRTPCRLEEVASGQHTVMVQMDKYAPQQVTVEVEDEKEAKVSITLNGRFAPVTIQSIEGAAIYVDSKKKGTTSYREDLMEGYYDVEVQMAHHKSVSKQIQVVAGQPLTLTLNPIPKSGTLDVVSTPRSADISIDGKKVGQTPYTVEQLLEGEHNFKMMPVKGGTFKMGANPNDLKAYDNEMPTHEVTLVDFYMGETEVTQSLWKAVMESEPTYRGGWKLKYGLGKEYPAYNISWEECHAFIEKLNAILAPQLGGKEFALPTEAEWEYAARGGNNSTVGYLYSGSNNIDNVAWYKERWKGSAHPVRQKQANNLGLYDMSGNVWEWCEDFDGPYYSNHQTNPTGPNSGFNRVYRGGSWNDKERSCRVSNRNCNTPDYRNRRLGFRLVLKGAPTLEFTVKDVSFKMLPVVGSKFTMGAMSDDSEANKNEWPLHEVTLNGFYMGETEVTQALWEAVMGSNPSNFRGDNRPVEMVTWNDCQNFINKLNNMLSTKLGGLKFALPTEAEWEYAARGGCLSKNCRYSGSNDANDVAWFDDNSGGRSLKVAQKKANELGFFDMAGNVWEWCADWYGNYSNKEQTSPIGPSSGSWRVIRGGSWFDSTRSCRLTDRYYYSPNGKDSNIGFRLVIRKAE